MGGGLSKEFDKEDAKDKTELDLQGKGLTENSRKYF